MDEHSIHFPLMPTEAQGWLDELIKLSADAVPALKALVILIFIDIITGVFAAIVCAKKDGPGLSSKTSAKGIMKKFHQFLYVFAGLAFQLVNNDMPWGKIVAMGLCLTEIISIVENAARSGVPLPKQLVEALAVMKRDQLAEEAKSKVLEVHVTPEAVPVIVKTEESKPNADGSMDPAQVPRGPGAPLAQSEEIQERGGGPRVG